MRQFSIHPTDKSLLPDIQYKIDNLNKPKGSLGLLEQLATQVCLVQQTLSPQLRKPCHLLFGGDHGIEKEGVSVSPRDVTWQQMENFTRGGGGVNIFCRQHRFSLKIIDVGVDHDFCDMPGIHHRKIARGTRNFLHQPAMTREQLDEAITIGAAYADECHSEGCNVLSIGEMGIANTSPSSILLHLLGHIDLRECIGIGAGLSPLQLSHKHNILRNATDRFLHDSSVADTRDVCEILRQFAGFEMAAAVGAMLCAAQRGMLILVDGFIMSACMLAASKLYPAVLDYAVFGHQGDEKAHGQMLRLMHATPLLRLGMRLGEGTGALCAYPLLDSAVRMINEMDNFQHANITKYF